MKRTIGKRILSAALVLVMLMGCLPGGILAVEPSAVEEKTAQAAESENLLTADSLVDWSSSEETVHKVVDGNTTKMDCWTTADMKGADWQPGGEQTPQYLVVDLGEGTHAVDSVKIWYQNNKVWATDYEIQTAASYDKNNKEATTWNTVATVSRDPANATLTQGAGQNIAHESQWHDEITAGTTPALTDTTLERYVRFYFKKTNDLAPGKNLNILEVEIFGQAEPDEEAPAAPTGLKAAPTKDGAVLTWTAATDNVGVTGYNVYLDEGDAAVDTVADTTCTLTGLEPETCYAVKVTALDAAGNESAPADVSFTTLALSEESKRVFFDDFTYTSADDQELLDFNWAIQEGTGLRPGNAEAGWSGDNVTFVEDEQNSSNTIMRLLGTTDGTAKNTLQSQIRFNEEKFQNGVYVSRIKFYDEAQEGAVTANDQGLATFFTINRLESQGWEPYSECDFEYLFNGGWGGPAKTMWYTTWGTYTLESAGTQSNPTKQSNRTDNTSLEGWHTLMIRVEDGKNDYYIDGELMASHTEPSSPDSPMSIAFNFWFLPTGLDSKTTGQRTYYQDVDWVYYTPNKNLSTEAVEAAVEALRAEGVERKDEIDAPDVTLESLTVDGSTLPGFAGDTTEYTYALSVGTTAAPSLSAQATDSEHAIVTITMPETLPGTATVLVQSSDLSLAKTYHVHFTVAGNDSIAAPAADVGAAAYTKEQTVSLSAQDGATIYYTTDGSTPTAESTVYSAPLRITESTMVKAIAVTDGKTSAVVSFPYTIVPITPQVAGLPTANVSSGTYTEPQTVTLTPPEKRFFELDGQYTIYYTTDGSTPTTASAVYTEPLEIDQSTTLKFIAAAPGILESSVVTCSYMIKDDSANQPSGQVIFSDGFEDGFEDWKVLNGTPVGSSDQKHEGEKSYLSNGNKNAIQKDFDQPYNALLSVWFYDTMEPNTIQIAQISANSMIAGIGVNSSVSSSKYVIRGDSAGKYTPTSVARSKGWHEFSWDATSGDHVDLFIDGELIGTSNTITTINNVFLGCNWANTGKAYYDDVVLKNKTLFEEHFENGQGEWTIENGTEFTTAEAPESKGLSFVVGQSGQDVGSIRKGFDTTVQGTVELWYYDTMGTDVLELSELAATAEANCQDVVTIGVNTNFNRNNYIYRIGSAYSFDSGVARSKGWHQFKWECTDAGTSMYIDGKLLNQQPAAFTGFQSIWMGDKWAGKNGLGYYDDLIVYGYVQGGGSVGSASDALAEITELESPSVNDTQLALPVVADGFTVSFAGSELEQVVAPDGKILGTNLGQHTVNMIVKVTNDADPHRYRPEESDRHHSRPQRKQRIQLAVRGGLQRPSRYCSHHPGMVWL